ncbi:MAG: PilZ domain-containing protein [Candidatus Acidiferrum sp.]
MPAQDRRTSRRLIMKVPLRFRPMKATSIPEETAAASMNISTHGVFFATDQKVSKGLLLQVHLKMPREIIGDDVEEWSFTARVAHVESLGAANEISGVGVQFLYYEVPRASI